MDPGECACSACPATPTGGRFGPAWLQVTLRPPCPATSVSVGTELPGDRASPGEARAEGPGRGSARGCGTGSRGGFRSDEAGEDTGRAGTVCSARAWLSRSVPGQRRVRRSGASSCEVILSPSEFRLSYLQGYRRWVTGLLLGPAFWPGQPRPERPPSEHLRRGLPGALPGLPVPRMRAGLGRLTARSTQKRRRPLSKLVRAPP